MFESVDTSLVEWSRAQFALTAMYHWLFVPLTLGLGVIQAIMETIYVRTGKEEWKTTAQFWMKLFGVNFAIGVATGLIMEFEFGTNWSNYSWFVGDIFGAPLAIEGIVAFFMEATFIAVMFFGWEKVSKRFHLVSTWLTIVGASLSALWILVANAWMQYPAGMQFNPDTVRNEMFDFWAVALSPVAINKFFHTVISSWIVGAVFVIGVSSWYLIKKREKDFALRSIRVAALFGLTASVLTLWTGDNSAYQVAQRQPMKLAAMEGLYQGKSEAELVAFGILNPQKKTYNDGEEPFLFSIDIPSMLSLLAERQPDAHVLGIDNLIEMAVQRAILDENFKYFGYGYIKDPADLIPPIGMTFYSFHIMVLLGGFFIVLFIAAYYMERKGMLEKARWMQYLSLISIPLAYVASQAGWIVAEVGRQPWAIQNIQT